MMTESKMPPKDACLAEATSEQSEQSVVSASVEELLQDGEIVLLVARPSPWFVLIDGAGVYLLILLGSLFCAWLGHKDWSPVAISLRRKSLS